LVDIWWCKR